jgi:anti-anti-sigma factor
MKNMLKQKGDVTVFNPIGDFDGGKDCIKTSQLFGDLIARGQRKFVINFQLTRWINSNGIGCLIAAKKTADQAGARMVLCGLERRNLSLIYTTHLEQVFEVRNTLNEALEMLKPDRDQAAAAGQDAPGPQPAAVKPPQ